MGLNQMRSLKKPKINPSQWQCALRGEQRSKAKCLYKMFIFGGLCGLVFGRALTPTRPTIELETEGRRQEASHRLPYPRTTRTGACSAFKVGHSKCCFCLQHTLRTHVTSVAPGPWLLPAPTTCQHTLSLSLQKAL